MNLKGALLSLVLAIMLSGLVITQPSLPMISSTMTISGEPSNEDIVNQISIQRISETISHMSGQRTRAFYTEGCWNTSIYIHDAFEGLGLWVYYQALEVRGFIVRNVVAIKNGSEANGPEFLFGAHYDSINKDDDNFTAGDLLAAPGADDDASGVAAVLEIATVLRNSSLPNTVKFVAFSAEESGLNGSRHFAQMESAAGVEYEGTAVFDMIGYRSGDKNRATIFCDSSSNQMSKSILSAVNQFDLNLSVSVVPGHQMVYSDHASFWEYGYPSLAITEEAVNYRLINPYYHTAEDILYHLSVDQIVQIAKAALGGFLLLEYPAESSQGWLLPAGVGLAVAVAVAIGIVYIHTHREDEL